MLTKPVLPNVRKIFIPDSNYTIYDADLKGADAQVVAWEAEDDDLKAAFRAGLDVHDKNAQDLWGSTYTQLSGDADNGPKSRKRKQCKQGVHLTNYGGTSRALAQVLGWTTHESDTFQKRWFDIHPNIKKNFQERIERSLMTTGMVYNKFGFRRVFFDRPQQSYTEALAWVPQSTVALVTYRGWKRFKGVMPLVELLMQVHDSLVFQVPKYIANDNLIRTSLCVEIPYSDPLTIPWGLAKSERSWGDCVTVV